MPSVYFEVVEGRKQGRKEEEDDKILTSVQHS